MAPDLGEALSRPERVRALRARLGLTQEQLAHRLGVSFATVNAWEKGRRRPSATSLQLIDRLEADGEASPTPARTPRPALPADRTPFLGREHELAELRAVWAGESRWLTLTGPGGVGKTRLAIELLRRCGEEVLAFVSLDSIHEAELVRSRVAEALGGSERSHTSGTDAVAAALAGRSGVVVLDTCEHVASAVAALADTLLHATGEARVLATSQVVLGVPGEQIYRVSPLDVPQGMKFFRARARSRNLSFTADGSEAVAIAEICRRLDGLPMTLELAAAWMRSASPTQLLERWEERESGHPDTSTVSGRQRSTQASVERSADLLSPPERDLIARLSVFAGPFTLPSAEAVCEMTDGSTLAGIRRLVDLSWLEFRAKPVPHYRMLDSLRTWGRAHLRGTLPEAVDPLRSKHAQHMLAFCRRAERARFRADQGSWPDRLELRRGDIEAALAWALTHDPVLGVALATCLLGWWRRSGGPAEAFHWLRAVAQSDLGPVDRARAESAEALILMDIGEYGDAERLSGSALAVLTPAADPTWRARALTAASSAAKYRGDPDTARQQLEEAVDLLASGADQHELAATYNNLGALTAEQHDLEAAAAYYGISLEIKESLGDRRSIALGMANLGDVHSQAGRLAEAKKVLDAGLAVSREIGDRFLATFVLINIGENQLRMDDPTAARVTFAQAYEAGTELAIPRFQALAACGEGQALLAANRPDEGLRRLRVGRSIAERIGDDIVLRQIRSVFAAADSDVGQVPAQIGFGLSVRELQVLQLVVDGRENSEIATVLGIKSVTVKNHLTNLYAKLNARNRTEAAGIAIVRGMRPTGHR